jgi:bifunctional ADP-heptose synthase (sugar kinase/adenylyltransferase)
LGALGIVDAVVIFGEDTPYDLIEQLQPDVLIKGSDYDIEENRWPLTSCNGEEGSLDLQSCSWPKHDPNHR